MKIMYKSTRGNNELFTSSQAILKGLADDGGLFIPDKMPTLNIKLADLKYMNYREIAFNVLKLFLTDFTDDELKHCINAAYDTKFDDIEIAPVVKVGNVHFLELFHGPTIAFKDMALSILPHLLTTAAKKNDISDEIVILTATSGDTGKAALAGFADVLQTRIIVFYPKGGVSKVQELQMVTQKGDNTFVVGVKGNFDDAQTGVKRMFNDNNLKKLLSENNFQFSSANSINIGRLIPQVAYYVWSYSRMLKDGSISENDSVNFVVPTGNFGNILAGYYAKLIGIPVNKLICASNDNKVVYDFFLNGTYDRKREFILTSSPSMDILISSNLERLIYMVIGEDSVKCNELMSNLSNDGKYSLSEEEQSKLTDFWGGYATENENAECIKKTFKEYNYITDTHTGVANCVYQKYLEETNDVTPTVIVSTASPYKFANSVMGAIDENYKDKDDFVLIKELNQISNVDIPKAINEIMDAKILHSTVCEIDDMENEVKKFLGIKG